MEAWGGSAGSAAPSGGCVVSPVTAERWLAQISDGLLPAGMESVETKKPPAAHMKAGPARCRTVRSGCVQLLPNQTQYSGRAEALGPQRPLAKEHENHGDPRCHGKGQLVGAPHGCRDSHAQRLQAEDSARVGCSRGRPTLPAQ